jgi:hypothetical protein
MWTIYINSYMDKSFDKSINEGTLEILEYKNYDAFSIFVYISIGFVFVFLLSMILDKILDYDSIKKKCSRPNIRFFTTDPKITDEEYDKQLEEQKVCDKKMKDFSMRKSMYAIIIGAISIFVGAYIAQSNPSGRVAGLGVAFGGFMSLLYFIILNWYGFSQNIQILILLVTFIVLIYGSVQMYNWH